METTDHGRGPEPPPESVSPTVPVPSKAGPATGPVARRGTHSGVLLVIAPAVGLAMGLGAWLLEETGLLVVAPAISEYNVMGTLIRDATPQTRHVASVQTAALTFGALGALTGMGLGLVGGLRRRRPRAALGAAATGLILAGAAAAGAAAALVPILLTDRHWLASSDLLASLVVHGGIAASLGAGAGFALGVGLGGVGLAALRTAALGALGALLGGLLYEVIGASFFPLAETSQPLAETATTRLLAFALIALGASAGAAVMASNSEVPDPRDVPKGSDGPA